MTVRDIELAEDIEASADYNWPGWSLSSNTFGKEFDLEARARMITGRDFFRLFISQFNIGSSMLEIGPFFSPTIAADALPSSSSIVYLENDRHALRQLRNQHRNNPSVAVIDGSIASIYADPKGVENARIRALLAKSDSILLSQVINYIHYRLLVKEMSTSVRRGTLVLINNVVDYGLPSLFHESRPNSIAETVSLLKEHGADIVKLEVVCAPRLCDNKRLLRCARF